MMEKGNIYSEKIIMYIKLVLIALLLVAEIILCAQTSTRYSGNQRIINMSIIGVCCVVLAVVETVDSFYARSFSAKIVFFSVDALFLFLLGILTGNTVLSLLYCTVLTQLYMDLRRVRDKFVLFAVSCVLYLIAFIIGWTILYSEDMLFTSAVSLFSGIVFGLLVLALDFFGVMFIMNFYRNNRELSAALKEADESRAALKEAYEQLSETAVFEERNRIAKDIHDNAGHSMTTVIMQTEAAKLLIDKDPQEAKNRIISANIQAHNALAQMRDSIHLLAGKHRTQSLKTEMESIVLQTIGGTDIKARYDIADIEVTGGASRFICNSLKECLANGIRHGRATAFYIEFKEENDMLCLFISDNGSGVDDGVKEGFGLGGMTAGATALGGSCTYSGENGEGFEVLISLPIRLKINKDKKFLTEVKND